MLGRILLGLASVAVGALAVAVIVKTVRGIINKRKIKNLAHSAGMKKVIIDSVDTCSNRVKITDLTTDKRMTINGDDIDDDICEGDVIRV